MAVGTYLEIAVNRNVRSRSVVGESGVDLDVVA